MLQPPNAVAPSRFAAAITMPSSPWQVLRPSTPAPEAGKKPAGPVLPSSTCLGPALSCISLPGWRPEPTSTAACLGAARAPAPATLPQTHTRIDYRLKPAPNRHPQSRAGAPTSDPCPERQGHLCCSTVQAPCPRGLQQISSCRPLPDRSSVPTPLPNGRKKPAGPILPPSTPEPLDQPSRHRNPRKASAPTGTAGRVGNKWLN